MTYVDGFVLTVPKKNKAKYRRMARDAGRIWKKHGALQFFECWGDDMNPDMDGMKFTRFPRMAKATPDESVVLSFIVYKSKAHRNRVNKAVMKEMDAQAEKHKDMPFDMKKMAYGGFTTIVEE